jgi:hypothetical protein
MGQGQIGPELQHFPVAHLISYISQFMVLEPGDLVLTIERLGSQRQTVVDTTPPSN